MAHKPGVWCCKTCGSMVMTYERKRTGAAGWWCVHCHEEKANSEVFKGTPQQPRKGDSDPAQIEATGAQLPLAFGGPVFDPAKDTKRLTGQLLRIFNVMADGTWRTLPEIAEATGDPEASISAQLRHLRKPEFGAHAVDKRRRGSETSGLWEYRLIPSKLSARSFQS